MRLTEAAIARLKTLVEDHPEDPIVRVTIKDLDERRLVFSITLESDVRTEDDARECDGLTVAVSPASASRLEGVTLDYREQEGFTFLHPEGSEADKPGGLNLLDPDLN
ncbi:MAG: HesB/IscA family protein [Nitrospirales bacterium]